MMVPPLNPGLFHLDPDHLWLMHCSEGPVPRSAAKAVQDLLAKELRPWELRWNEDSVGLPQALREEIARLFALDAADVALAPSTSAGLQAVARGLDWKAGDEVVLPLGEFPATALPWKALAPRGISLMEVPLWDGHKAGAQAWDSAPPTAAADPESKLIRFVQSGARALVVSWIRFQDGLKLDLARLGKACRERDVVLVVDGIQGAGTFLPDLTHVGAFASGGQKGLISPQGTGFLWTRPDLRRQLLPLGTWLSMTDGPATDFSRPWQPDGRRLEPGSLDLLACAAMTEGIKALQSPGVAAITDHVRKLQHHLLNVLDLRGIWKDEVKRLRGLLEADRLGPILAFHHGGQGPEAMQELVDRGQRRGIYASVREGYLRMAFHGWHEAGDVERIAEWLEA